MKPWKLVLGAGAACAACCAVPLVTGAAALGIGSGLFAAGLGTVAAMTASLPLLLAAVVIAGVLAALVALRRRAAAAPAKACGCGASSDAAPACGRGGD